MITYREAYLIAQSANPYNGVPFVGANKTPNGWVFDLEQQTDESGLPVPGGPSPIFVSSADGKARGISLPSDEGFEILDSIIEEDIALPS